VRVRETRLLKVVEDLARTTATVGRGMGTRRCEEQQPVAAQGQRDVGTATLGLRCGDTWRYGRGPEGSVQRKLVPPCADRRALAGLGVRARGNRGGARGMARSGVQGANPF
jgi:hypothetical protein